MSIFLYENYKVWVNDVIKAMPKGGRGQFRRLAEFMNISPTIVTQVFKGERDLSPEQSVLLSEYLGLSKIETRFLLLLVRHSRAGSYKYKEVLKEEIEELRKHAHEIKSRVSRNVELSDEAKATLYSNWYYLAIWSLVAIGGLTSPQEFAERLSISSRKATDALEFLKQHALIVAHADGTMAIGANLVHLESDSPQIPRHHQNWRIKAFRSYESPSEHDAFYTAPVTLAKKDVPEMREKLLKVISECVALVKDSPSEELYCLCLDWFKI